ncbi:MAG: M48 family metallopeptidase [Candidatus Omnitrophica bacterium]|nr:M48 family metallopeptidase [Candidatus Omnitrophota bacterium]
MNIYLIIILVILIGKYILNTAVEILNIKHTGYVLPAEFEGYYDARKYQRSQQYLKEKTFLAFGEDAAVLVFTLVLILSGGFDHIDKFARTFHAGYIMTGLIFIGAVVFIYQILNIPFSLLYTFVLEEKYGFNKTKPGTFILDLIKTWILAAVLGGIAFAGIIWFFDKWGPSAWSICWVALSCFQLFLVFIAPVLILPVFNKFIPLPEGQLRKEIEDYARTQNFRIQGIFRIDASRRSAKSNAFFTGFGKFRRIALFDTLIAKHTKEELVSILAHEIGHYKMAHIIKHMTISILTEGLMLFILSLFLNNRYLFGAFGMEHLSIHASLVFFAFLYAPINMIFSVITNSISRRHEYAADTFAVSTYKNKEAYIRALKKLSVDNLSNLTPHPLKVFLQYSHPPVLERIQAIAAKPP